LTEGRWKNRVVTEDKLDDIGHRLEYFPRNSLKRLAQQSGVSVGSAWTATTLLHIHPNKITLLSAIKPMDYGKRVRFYNWFINQLCKLFEYYAVGLRVKCRR
jgi:hypothetical protein